MINQTILCRLLLAVLLEANCSTVSTDVTFHKLQAMEMGNGTLHFLHLLIRTVPVDRQIYPFSIACYA